MPLVAKGEGRCATRMFGTVTVVIVAATVLTACSSRAHVGATGPDSAYSGPPLASNASSACTDFYAFDLFHHRVARDTGSGRERTRALAELTDLAETLAASTLSASTIGDLPRSTRTAARKILRVIEVWTPTDRRIRRQSAVIEAACTAAGWSPPQDNIDARENRRSR